jgi:hypothetical protein
MRTRRGVGRSTRRVERISRAEKVSGRGALDRAVWSARIRDSIVRAHGERGEPARWRNQSKTTARFGLFPPRRAIYCRLAMWRRVGFGLVAAVVAITSIVACRQLVGITDNPPEDLTSSLCGLNYGTNVCASCVNTNCCTESTTCASDPVCAAYESCLGECNGDPKCRSQCTIDNLVGTASDVWALRACLAGKCETACGLECGGLADLVAPPDAAAACQQCVTGSACSQEEACASSYPCTADLGPIYLSTVDFYEVYAETLCESSAAAGLTFNIGGQFKVCGRNPPTIESDDAGSHLSTSFANSCTTACASGAYWACVGQVNWPSPEAPTTTLGFWIKDYVTDTRVAGALVRVCQPHDENCTQPLAMGTTDIVGQVSLTFQNGQATGAGLNNGAGLNGFLRVTSPTIVPFDYYWGFPFVEAQVPSIFGTVITPSELQDQWNAVGVTTDPARGTVSVYVTDCRLNAASGVEVTLSPMDKLTQSFASTGASTTMTGPDGILTFANVPAGALQITATPLALGKPSSQVNIIVQAGYLTLATMYPTPSP